MKYDSWFIKEQLEGLAFSTTLFSRPARAVRIISFERTSPFIPLLEIVTYNYVRMHS